MKCKVVISNKRFVQQKVSAVLHARTFFLYVLFCCEVMKSHDMSFPSIETENSYGSKSTVQNLATKSQNKLLDVKSKSKIKNIFQA